MPRLASYGYHRVVVPFLWTATTGTGQVVICLSKSLGFQGVLEKAELVPNTAGTGAGATRTVNVRKGNASGTVVATIGPTLANAGTIGTFVAGTVTASAATFLDSDTLSVEVASGGTAFTAGAFEILLTFRARSQREA